MTIHWKNLPRCGWKQWSATRAWSWARLQGHGIQDESLWPPPQKKKGPYYGPLTSIDVGHFGISAIFFWSIKADQPITDGMQMVSGCIGWCPLVQRKESIFQVDASPARVSFRFLIPQLPTKNRKHHSLLPHMSAVSPQTDLISSNSEIPRFPDQRGEISISKSRLNREMGSWSIPLK